MTPLSSPPVAEAWRSLFPQGKAACPVVVIRKHGHVLLVLAGNARFSPQSLELYPAQSSKARLLRKALGLVARLRLLPLFFGEELRFDPLDPLARKLTAGNGSAADFAILCGNPNAKGRRFMILSGPPGERAIIKAGISPAAWELVVREACLLEEIQNMPHTPALADRFQTAQAATFSTPFIDGDSPSPAALEDAAVVLNSWILPEEVTLGDLPAWQRLQSAVPSLSPSLKAIAARRVTATLGHGDFAPWNIKVTPLGWTVLDWERGEKLGIPAWDWFHFLIQPKVLVARLAPREVFEHLEVLLSSPLFQEYAHKTKIRGLEWRILAAYLESMIYVHPPSEGLEPLKALRQLVLEKAEKEI